MKEKHPPLKSEACRFSPATGSDAKEKYPRLIVIATLKIVTVKSNFLKDISTISSWWVFMSQ